MGGERLRDRFRGAILGTFTGDALGRAFEGHRPAAIPAEAIEARHRGIYTDDTEMALILADSLARDGRVDPDRLARRFAEGCDPARGYAGGALRCLGAIRSGVPWRVANRSAFPDGSFGNGAAMRVAPAGAFHFDDPDGLFAAARDQARITHAHPLGWGGAVIAAAAVAEGLRAGLRSDAGDARPAILDRLEDTCNGLEPDARCVYREALGRLRTLLEDAAGPDARDPSPVEVARVLGNTVEAHRSVPAAIYAFLRGGSFEAVALEAVRIGGDADTIAAMACGMAGARWGLEGIPARWFERLEKGPRGRGFAIAAADRLYEAWRGGAAGSAHGGGSEAGR